jgi:hypothetical protein
LKSDRRFISKARGKLKSETALAAVRAKGTQAVKDKAAADTADLRKAINDYLTGCPNALAKGKQACLQFLKKSRATFDYADATILDPHIKDLFAAKRRALKAEN